MLSSRLNQPISLAILLAAVALAPAIRIEAAAPGVPFAQVSDFSLPTTDGGSVSLSADVDVTLQVICFLGTECPLARVYGPRLQRMSDEYHSRGVRFLGINSNLQDSMEDLRRYVSEHDIRFPIAKDYDRSVAIQIKARRTPEVFVIDRGGIVCYSGRIDNQYQPGIARSEATQHDLRDAIDQLLAGHPVVHPRTEAVGCLISLPRERTASKSDSDVTFCKQVIRVLQEHCVECHRDGEIGPFALDEYDEVVGWADMALEVIDQGRMPPWHADPRFGSFANARHMPDEAKQILHQWVESGTPYGSAADLPAKREYVQGWQLPAPPDVVLCMADEPFQVPADGTVEYQYFVVDPGFKEDKWVSAVEVVPGNRAVVHHCIAFIRPPDGADFRDIGLLSAYVPGQRSVDLPEGYARRIPARSKIVFQVHYTPTGKPETDLTRIGLVLADPDQVTHEVYALGGIEQDFEIPPQASNFTVSGRIRSFPENGLLLSIAPHMHLRGKSYQLTAESDTGNQTLLSVPQYDFNWQHSYELKNPLPLQSVRTLRFTATFDNSSNNPTNPDPTEYVTWGDQTWQEMAVTFISVAEPRVGNRKPVAADTMSAQQQQDRQAELTRQADAFADRYIARFDKNGDGSLASHELPDSVRRWGNLDHNFDDHISRDELIEEFYWRLPASQ